MGAAGALFGGCLGAAAGRRQFLLLYSRTVLYCTPCCPRRFQRKQRLCSPRVARCARCFLCRATVFCLLPPPTYDRVHLRKTPLGADVDVPALAAATAGYTGADIGSVVREAALAALEESLAAEQVCQRHFTAALSRVQPSVDAASPSAALTAMYERFSRQGVAAAQ